VLNHLGRSEFVWECLNDTATKGSPKRGADLRARATCIAIRGHVSGLYMMEFAVDDPAVTIIKIIATGTMRRLEFNLGLRRHRLRGGQHMTVFKELLM
jgi:hypothetical protein